MEVPTTELNEQGEFEYGTQLVRGTEPSAFGANDPRPLQPTFFGRPGDTFQGLIPTRNYNELQTDGSYKLIEQNAPIPFIGRPELADTGNPLVNFGADMVGLMGQLVAISRTKIDGKRLSGELSATTQRLLKANPRSIRGISRKGFEEFLPASVVQSMVRTAGMPGEGSTTGGLVKAFADLPVVKENVDAKLLERVVDVTNIDPDDPLLERVTIGIADELLVNAQLGRVAEVGFFGLNQLRRATGEVPASALRHYESIRDVIAKSLQFMRAQVIGEELASTPTQTVDPRVKIVRASDRRNKVELEQRLESGRRLEEIRAEQGIERPEQFEQPELRPVEPEALIAQSQQSAADAVQEYSSSLAEQMIESAPPGAMPELEQVDIGTMFNMPRQNLYAAPQQLQYKAAGRVTKSGASGSLTEAEVFNPAAAKALLVWKDAKGEIDPQNPGRYYVVDGHNRLELANRLNFNGGLNVIEIKADTVAQARVQGAIANIADSKGTGIDAAKLLRDTGMSKDDLRRAGATGELARLGIGMRDLPQDVFDMVVAGKLTEKQGAIIGSGGLEPQVQRDIASVALKKKWGEGRIEEAVMMGTEATVGEAGDPTVIPGLDIKTIQSSDFANLMDTRRASRSLLKAELSALGTVVNPKKQVFRRRRQRLSGRGQRRET